MGSTLCSHKGLLEEQCALDKGPLLEALEALGKGHREEQEQQLQEALKKEAKSPRGHLACPSSALNEPQQSQPLQKGTAKASPCKRAKRRARARARARCAKAMPKPAMTKPVPGAMAKGSAATTGKASQEARVIPRRVQTGGASSSPCQRPVARNLAVFGIHF